MIRRSVRASLAGAGFFALVAASSAAPPVITAPPASQTIFLGDPVTFRVSASGTEPLSYQWFRNDSAISGATTSTLGFTTSASDHNAEFVAQVTNISGAVTSAPGVLTIDFGDPGPVQTQRLVEITNVWRYHVAKADLGTAWTGIGYPDGGWAAGGGLLYVETSALPAPKTTPLSLTPGSLPMTCYFRTRFLNTITNTYSLSLVANTVIDDGLVAHLNGAEAFRVGMRTNLPVGYSTNANRTVGNAVWEGPFPVPITNLLTGTNVLAVEVHQITTDSTDIVMGLTLDAVWQERQRDSNAPVAARVIPAPGSTVPTLTQLEVQFSEAVQGVDASDLLINGIAATNLTALSADDYLFQFPSPSTGTVSVTWFPGHGIMDRSANSNAFTGTTFDYWLDPASALAQLCFARVTQSSDASTANTASQAVDGLNTTSSLTLSQPGSWWQADLGRPYPLGRVELVNRASPNDLEMAGLVLQLFNLDDQVVFQTNLWNPGPGGTLAVRLPGGTTARSLWIGLPAGQTNGAGNFRVGLAEVRAFGLPKIPYSPEPIPAPPATVRVWQSSEYGGFPASNAVDDDTGNFSHTADVVNSYWMADLGQAVSLDKIEVVNRSGCCDKRLDGLMLRIYDGASNNVAATVMTNPGLGGTWNYSPAAGTKGRWVRVGLEGGQTNADGNYFVSLAEVRAYSGTTNVLRLSPVVVPVTNNLASFRPSCMLRLDDSVPVASQANDDRYSTETKTTLRTVDGYWEVDLGNTYALYGVRSIAASGIGYRLTNAIVRLYDAAHDSVYSQKITGVPDAFDTDLNGPVFARYVRVGLEDKQRTDPAGGIEFFIGFREVEVFGRPTNNIGIVSFNASATQVEDGESVNLSWAVDDVRRVEIHPGIGSVGAYTGTNGVGTLTVTVTNSTEFILVATSTAGTFSRAVAVQVTSNTLPLRMSEIVAENRYSLQDGYGEAPDWIEIRNQGNVPVNLSGWSLSDDPALPNKWVFPSTNLAPHASLVVFASGRATPIDPAGNLHAAFRLEKNGGAVLLTSNNGTRVVDAVSYPELDADLAYGRDLDGAWRFLEPTPGNANASTGYLGWIKQMDWSHMSGFYEAGFTLTLTNNSPGATVYYSLDGSIPGSNYTRGLSITRTTAVRAQAVRAGYKPSRIQTKTYIFLNDVITSSVMNTAITQDPAYAPRLKPGLLALPSLSICVPGQPEYEEKEGSFEVLWPGGDKPVQVNCGILRFGNAWTQFAKRSFRVKCRARYGDAKVSVPLFNGFDRGVLAKTSFDELDLRSGSQDMVERGFYMAGRFVEDTMLDMGSLNPHGRFVHVYLNGVYWGQYDCREMLVEHFLADYLGGTAEDYVVVRGNDNVGDEFVLGAPEPPNVQPWENVLSLRNSYQSVRSSLDVQHLVDFMLLWNYGNSESEYRCCGPIQPGSGFKFWIADADGFLRTSAMGLNRTTRNGPGGLFGGLVAEGHPDFKTLVADRIYRHFFNEGALTPAANDRRLAARMQEIHDSLIAECARWGYRTPANWETAAASIRSNLFPARTSQLLGYLRTAGLYPVFDPPSFNLYGGLVTNGFQPVLASTNGIILYTLDGSDPRLAGGGIAPQARVWTAGAVTITNDLTLNLRVRSSTGQWSALAQPTYLLATRRAPSSKDLLITEVHYNPAGSDEFEFVELYNASTNLLDLSGVSLSNAVRFVFPPGSAVPPGAFVVVVESTASFAARYQARESPYYFPGITVAGQWVGGLGNDGDTVSLVASNGFELAAIPYRTSGAWPERADGDGSSMELQNFPPTNSNDLEAGAWLADGHNWTSSSLYHGSPGRLDHFAKSVRFSEILPHTDLGADWLELWNSGAEAVNLQDCALTDNMDTPAQWLFPTNLVLNPGQYSLLSVAGLPFAFSELGDQVFLLQMASTNVIRFLDSVDFPAAEREESFGLFMRSDGEFDFTELRVNTPGAPNALPRVGPVVISEILFSPAAGKAAFIELANITSVPVPLYDTTRPTNVWRLEGVGDFLLPSGTVLTPCSTLIVCSTNAAAFREQYELPPEVPVLGPWSGTLDADGETLKLLRPGSPEPDGTVPYYRVDHVTYQTNAPWPQASGNTSLERLPPEAYGNEPANWRTTPIIATPGTPATNRPPVILVSGAPMVPQQAQLTLALTVADLDAPWQAVDLSAAELPPGGTFDPALNLFSWVPSPAQQPGLYTARFVATDNSVCQPTPTVLNLAIEVTPPLCLSAQYSGGELQLSFPAVPGGAHLIEFCTDLDLANWQLLQEISVTQSRTVHLWDFDFSQDAARFYRVRWQR